MKWFLLLLALSCAISCGSSPAQNNNKPSAEPSPSVSTTHVNTSKSPFPNEEDDPLEDEESRRHELEGLRAEARENAINYAQQNFPGWKVKGVITRQTFDKHYQVTLDLEKGSQTKTVQPSCGVSFQKRVSLIGKQNLSSHKTFPVRIKSLLT